MSGLYARGKSVENETLPAKMRPDTLVVSLWGLSRLLAALVKRIMRDFAEGPLQEDLGLFPVGRPLSVSALSVRKLSAYTCMCACPSWSFNPGNYKLVRVYHDRIARMTATCSSTSEQLYSKTQ